MSNNNSLHAAREAKNDEFYTRYRDIEREINSYMEYNQDIFRDKTVLLPCDDPEWSNFTKFFAENFERMGIRKLISTSYAHAKKNVNFPWSPTLFETDSELYNKELSPSRGKIFVLDRENGDGQRIDIDNLKWKYLNGTGDFQSLELKSLRDEADVIVTNPPFSLFREFVSWLFEKPKQFIIIGNQNAVTYKELFPLIKDNKMWLGVTNYNTGMYFYVPDGFVYAKTYKFERKMDGKAVNRVPACCWYTNIDHGRRHKPLALMTQEENIKYSSHKQVRGIGYLKYENYDAIEVPYVDAIPEDYDGIMGVPVTFLDKYCPEQFEIIKFRKGDDDKDLVYTNPDGKQVYPYFRILIRRKQ